MSEVVIAKRGGTKLLNLFVVGGTTQPTSPKENTLWVNTSTAITGWVFSDTKPTSPVEGMVWFTNGTASLTPLNAIKKNGLWVYPTACQQYVSGAWVSKTARVYTGGAWKDWFVYLYKNGDQCADVSGGWTGQTTTGSSSIKVNKFYGTATMKTKKAVDLSLFKTIVTTYAAYVRSGQYTATDYDNLAPSNCEFRIVSESSGSTLATFGKHSSSSGNQTISKKTINTSIAAINEPCYIHAYVFGATSHASYGGEAYITLYEMQLK